MTGDAWLNHAHVSHIDYRDIHRMAGMILAGVAGPVQRLVLGPRSGTGGSTEPFCDHPPDERTQFLVGHRTDLPAGVPADAGPTSSRLTST